MGVLPKGACHDEPDERVVSDMHEIAEWSSSSEWIAGGKTQTAVPPVIDPQIPSAARPAVHHHPSWGGRTFRFRLTSFRIGRDFATRRFSVTEAAFLLMMAYLTSNGLVVIRQTLFNALFGTGPQATAYYAAFTLPDTLFNLIAGGAFIYAFIPVFLS